MDDELESEVDRARRKERKREEDEANEGEMEPRKRRMSSRRNTMGGGLSSPQRPLVAEPYGELSAAEEDGDTTMPIDENEEAVELEPDPALEPVDQHQETASDADVDDEVEAQPDLVGDEEDLDEEIEDDEEGDPDDPNEPKYCYCDRGSYGEMIACDNEACPREWFHLGCTGLGEPPEEEEKWYCRECAPLFAPAPAPVPVAARGGRGGGGTICLAGGGGILAPPPPPLL